MKLVRPIRIDDSVLASSSVPEVAPAAYNGATTYATGALVSVATGTARDVYRSLQNANTGNAPATSPLWWIFVARTYVTYAADVAYALNDIVIDPVTHLTYQSLQAANTGHALAEPGSAWWIETGPSNRWAMFDERNATATEANGQIVWAVDVAGRADVVALLGLVGVAVNITAMVGATEVYNQDFDLINYAGITDYWAYCFEARTYKRDLIATNLPPYSGMQITVTLTGPATVRVANCIVGKARTLGATAFGMRLGIDDFSKKGVDDFGRPTLIVRDSARRGFFTVYVSGESAAQCQGRVDSLIELLDDYRATVVLWIGSPRYGASAIYGWYESFEVEVELARQSICTLSIKGIS